MIKDILEVRFIRFLLVGGLNTAFGYGCYCLLIWLGMHYSLAVVCSTFLGILFNFKTTGVLVFNSRDNSLIFRFFATYGLGMGLNIAGVAMLKAMGLDDYLAGFVMLAPMAVINYTLMRLLVFRT